MSVVRDLLELHDLDRFIALLAEPAQLARLKRSGYRLESAALERERAKLLEQSEKRWAILYERSRARYGRGLTEVRARVCQGCFVTLPISAAPPAGESQLHLCEGCGRLVYWA